MVEFCCLFEPASSSVSGWTLLSPAFLHWRLLLFLLFDRLPNQGSSFVQTVRRNLVPGLVGVFLVVWQSYQGLISAFFPFGRCILHWVGLNNHLLFPFAVQATACHIFYIQSNLAFSFFFTFAIIFVILQCILLPHIHMYSVENTFLSSDF